MVSPVNGMEVTHPVWGRGTLVRIEGTDWIVSFKKLPMNIRIRAEDRKVLEIHIPQEEPAPRTSQPVDNEPCAQTQAVSTLPALAEATVSNTTEPTNPVNDWRSSEVTETEHMADIITPDVLDDLDDEIEVSEEVDTKHEERVPVGASAVVDSPKRTGRDLLKMRAIESLANGLPASGEFGRNLAVGFTQTKSMIDSFLEDVQVGGGGATVIRGQYGQGKTFALRALEDIAYEAGFLVAKTEVDATENRLNKPFHIYRDLMKNLRVPGKQQRGARTFAREISSRFPKQVTAMSVSERFEWLKTQCGCEPIAWLFSDGKLLEKPELLGLLAADQQWRITHARPVHSLRMHNQIWPAFTAGTQGDFASYILSGMSLLGKRLGFKGLILIMDEMEKWENLNWNEQIQAGNLLGGLIWGATNSGDRRRTYRYPGDLQHSLRCGGYPFSTEKRCHLGLAIAMTPRSEGSSPEGTWHEYGTILDVNLPQLNTNSLKSYIKKLAVLYAEAYGHNPPDHDELATITDEAIQLWREGYEMNTRSAVQSAVAALERWRDGLFNIG